jgi:hypothetical protein
VKSAREDARIFIGQYDAMYRACRNHAPRPVRRQEHRPSSEKVSTLRRRCTAASTPCASAVFA